MSDVSMMEKIERALAKLSFSHEERLVFYEQMQGFLEDGLSAYEAMGLLHTIYNEIGDVRKHIMMDGMNGIRVGKNFGESLKDWIGTNELMLLVVGERSGDIINAIKEIQSLIATQESLKEAIRSSLGPPAFYLMIVYGFIYFLAWKVLPAFALVSPPEKWPDFSKYFFGAVNFFYHNTIIIVPLIIGFIWLLVWAMPNFTADFRKKMDKFFPFTLYRRIQSSFFLITISSLLRTGVPLTAGLKTLIPYSPPYVAQHMERMLENIHIGLADGEILSTGLMMRDTELDLKAYAKSSNFSRGIEALGRRISKTTDRNIRKTAKIVEGMITLFLAFFIISTLYAAIYVLLAGTDGTGMKI